MIKWQRNSGIMLALDVEDSRTAFELLDRVGGDIDLIKLNYPLILLEGLSLIGEIKDRYQKPILADFKVADLPETNNRIIRICRDAGADGIMIQGFIGIDAIQSAIETAEDMKVFVVTQLSSPGGLDYTAHFTEEFAGLARMLGAAGVQAPGNRPNAVRKVRTIVGDELVIVCDGIEVPGESFGQAIEAGGDFEIIGRAIYQAEEPSRAVKEIKATLAPFIAQ